MKLRKTIRIFYVERGGRGVDSNGSRWLCARRNETDGKKEHGGQERLGPQRVVSRTARETKSVGRSD